MYDYEFQICRIPKALWDFEDCPQEDAKQCYDATKLDCTHCVGHWPAQWPLSSFFGIKAL